MARIGIEVTAANEQSAGIGRLVYELVRAVIAANVHHEIVLFSARTSRPQTFEVEQRHASFSQAWLLRLWRLGLPLYIERWTGRVALFHATDFVLPPLRKPTRAVLTVHDLAFVRVPEAATDRLKRYLNVAVKRSVQRADLIIADSRATMHDLIDLYNVPQNKLAVVYPALPAHRINPTLSLQALFPQLQRPYMLAVGTVQPRKNYARVVQALAQLLRRGLDVDLVIAGGKGWLQDDLYQAIEVHQLEQRVHVLGFVPDEALTVLYRHALCLVYPSLYEGFGFPILEGMAHGVPVVTSNVSSMPEVAGNAALLVDPYNVDALTDALERILTDTELRMQLIQQGYLQVQTFSWIASAQQLLTLYDQLLTP